MQDRQRQSRFDAIRGGYRGARTLVRTISVFRCARRMIFTDEASASAALAGHGVEGLKKWSARFVRAYFQLSTTVAPGEPIC